MSYDSYVSLSITMKCYGWSKWGGAREGMVKEELETWYCQACGEPQAKILPSYMIPIDQLNRDYARICTVCKVRMVVKKLSEWDDLIDLLR